MGRVRGKGKKQTIIAAREDPGSGEEEKILVRKRGRPTKLVKDEIEEEEEGEMIEEEEEANGENIKSSISNKDIKNQNAAEEDGRKRKRPSHIKENCDSVEEKSVGTKTDTNGMIKSVGYRPNGSRRKNKPRRAAEVGVECK